MRLLIGEFWQYGDDIQAWDEIWLNRLDEYEIDFQVSFYVSIYTGQGKSVMELSVIPLDGILTSSGRTMGSRRVPTRSFKMVII